MFEKRRILTTNLKEAFLLLSFHHRLESLHINVIRDQTLPDEHLYGRCGYLSALLFVQHHLGADKVDREVIIKVTLTVIFVLLYHHNCIFSIILSLAVLSETVAADN